MSNQTNPAQDAQDAAEILIAEDSPTQAERLSYLLEQHGYRVTVANNGKQALACLGEHRPALVISDIVMPEMNGYELCQRIKADERTWDVPVILLTSLSDPEDVLEGLACGADNFITKPYSADYLLAHVQQILANSKLRKTQRVRIGMEILFAGKKRFITADQQQMLTLLISTYEAAVHRNSELIKAQEELSSLTEHLEDLVEERTTTLTAEIAERKRAEDSLRESEERYRRLVELLPDGVVVHSEGRVVFANPASARIIGAASPAELTGKPVMEFVHPEYRELVLQRIRQSLSEGGPATLAEEQFIRLDGTPIDVEVAAIPFSYAGKPAMLTVVNDITARKQAAAALAAGRTLLRTLVDNLPDAVYVKDLAGRKTLANPACQRHMGVASEAEALGKTDFDVYPPDLAAAFAADDQHVIQTGQPVLNREERITLPDGSLGWQLTAKAPLRDRAGQVIGLVGIGHDITARKQAEESLRESLTDLQRSNADLQQFAYVASHDLQEPLRMVASFVQLLGMRYQGRLDADADEFIGYAVEGAARMQQLILDLLEYSKVGTCGAPLAPTDATVVCQAVLRDLELAIAESRATVVYDPLPTVLADAPQLAQVFQNLIANSIKFRGTEPPHVHIAAQLQIADCRLQIDASIPQSAIHDPKSEWVFSVRDNGIGIDPAYFERIFVIFQRLHTRDAYPGTGIGLAVCKRIVERHGGRIWVESAPGQGATFYFTLPAAT